jgi:hypothetical protein
MRQVSYHETKIPVSEPFLDQACYEDAIKDKKNIMYTTSLWIFALLRILAFWRFTSSC